MSVAPTTMVSSTFYDLRQIRADLSAFISDELGYIPLLSELPSFPTDPDIDTIENCRRRVDQNADILVLVIGGRYGSIDQETDKSITNLEFLSARNKGIPVYAFIDKGILSILPIWKANPAGNFATVVDTPRVFEFIELVRSQERVWTFAFESARDIVTVLRIQLAYLFQESLKLRLLLGGSALPRSLERLRPRALRLALERPKAWEYRLFLQSLIDEVERRTDLVREYREGLLLEASTSVSASDAPEWFLTRLHELQSLVASANRLINESAQEAFGKPGEPGDVEHIVWVSRMVAVVLENTIKWATRIRCTRLASPFDLVAPEAALFVEDLISQFTTFPRDSLNKVEDALLQPPSGKPQELRLVMTLTLANQSRFFEALESAQRHYSAGGR